jgi:phosphopantetheinyl transferase
MAKKVIKINTNPVPKVTIKTFLLQQTGQNTLENSRLKTGPYGQPTFDNNKKVDNIKG